MLTKFSRIKSDLQVPVLSVMATLDERFPTYPLETILAKHGFTQWPKLSPKPKRKCNNVIFQWAKRKLNAKTSLLADLQVDNENEVSCWQDMTDRQMMVLCLFLVESLREPPLINLKQFGVVENELISEFLEEIQNIFRDAQREAYGSFVLGWYKRIQRQAENLIFDRFISALPAPNVSSDLENVLLLMCEVKAKITEYINNNGVWFSFENTQSRTLKEIETEFERQCEEKMRGFDQLEIELKVVTKDVKDLMFLRKSILSDCANEIINESTKAYWKTFKTQHGVITVNCKLNEHFEPEYEVKESEIENIFLKPLQNMKNYFRKFIPSEENVELGKLNFNYEHFQNENDTLKLWKDIQTRKKEFSFESDYSQFLNRILQLRKFINICRNSSKTSVHGPFLILFESLWSDLVGRSDYTVKREIEKLKSLFLSDVQEKTNSLRNIARLALAMYNDPDTMLQNQITIMESKTSKIPILKQKVLELWKKYSNLIDHIHFSMSEQTEITEMCSLMKQLPGFLSKQQSHFDKMKTLHKTRIEEKRERMKEKANEMVEEGMKFKEYSNVAKTEKYQQHARDIRQRLMVFRNQINQLNNEEVVLGLEISTFQKLNNLYDFTETVDMLYTNTIEFISTSEKFLCTSRLHAEVEEMRISTDHYLEMLNQLDRKFVSVKAIQHYIIQNKNQATTFRQGLQILGLLATKELRQRHWDKMSSIVEFDLLPYTEVSMGELLQLGLESCQNQLEEITKEAQIEEKLEIEINSIVEKWGSMAFDMKSTNYWNVEIVSNLIHITQVLEADGRKMHELNLAAHHLTNMELQDRINYLQTTAVRVRQQVEMWDILLEQWFLFGSLMSRQDAQLALQTENKRFRTVTKYWREISKYLTVKNTNNIIITLFEWNALSQWLNRCETHLKYIEMGLGSYIKKKKLQFPRLHLLSDNEILDIMTSTSKHKIEILVRKCFPGISAVSAVEKNITIQSYHGDTLKFSFSDRDMCSLLTDIKTTMHEFLTKEIQSHSETRKKKPMGKQVDQFVKQFKSEGTAVVLKFINGKYKLHGSTGTRDVQLEFMIPMSIHADNSFKNDSNELVSYLFTGSPVLILGDYLNDCLQCVMDASSQLYKPFHLVQCSPQTTLEAIENLLQVCYHGEMIICFEAVSLLNDNVWDTFFLQFEFLVMTDVKPTKVKLPKSLKIHNISTGVKLSRLDHRVSSIKELTSKLNELWQNTRCVCIAGSPLLTQLVEQLESDNRNVQLLFPDTFTDEQLVGNGNGGFVHSHDGCMQRLLNEQSKTNCIVLVDNGGCTWLQFVVGLLRQHMEMTEYMSLPNGSTVFQNDKMRYVICLAKEPSIQMQHLLNSTGQVVIHLDFQYDHYIVANSEEDLKNNLSLKSEIGLRTKELVDMVIVAVTRNTFTNCKFKFDGFLVSLLILIRSEVAEFNKIDFAESIWLDWVVLSPLVQFLSLMDERFHQPASTELMRRARSANCDILYFPSPLTDFKFSMSQMAWVNSRENMEFSDWMPFDTAYHELFYISTQIDQLIHMTLILIRKGHSFVITGDMASGKTAFIKMISRDLSADHEVVWIPSVFYDDLYFLRSLFERHFSVERKDDENLDLLFIVDNFKADTAVTAILRMLFYTKSIVKNGKIHSVDRNFKFIIVSTNESWIDVDCQKLFGLLPVLPFPSLTVKRLTRIFENILSWHLQLRAFSTEYLALVPSLAVASVQLITDNALGGKFPLFDLVSLCKGLMFSWPDITPDTQSLIRLWVHESMRILGDRLRTDKNHSLLFDKFKYCLEEHLDTTMYSLFKHLDLDQDGTVDEEEIGHLIFCEFSSDSKAEGFCYIDVRDKNRFEVAVKNFLNEYNQKVFYRNKLQLVISSYTAEHITHVSRVLRQADCHVILLGKIGFGRGSCARLAAHITQTEIYEIDVTSTTSLEEWREIWKNQLHNVLTKISHSNNHVMILICIGKNNDVWLSDIHNWLNSSEPLFITKFDQIEQLRESIIGCEKNQIGGIKLPGQRERRMTEIKEDSELLETLEIRLKEQLHLVLIMETEHYDHLKGLDRLTCDFYAETNEIEQQELLQSILRPEIASNLALDWLYEFIIRLINIGYESQMLWRPINWHFYQLCLNFDKIYGWAKQLIESQMERLQIAENCIAKIENTMIKPNNDWEQVNKIIKTVTGEIDVKVEEIGKQEELAAHLREVTTEEEAKLIDLERKIEVLRNQITAGTQEPTNSFKQAHQQIKELKKQDFKQFVASKRPSVQVRHAAECLRTVFETKFVPSKNSVETWQSSCNYFTNGSFFLALRQYDEGLLPDSDVIDRLKKYAADKQFKPNLLVKESKVASIICNWTIKLIDFHRCQTKYQPISDELTLLENQYSHVKMSFTSNKKELQDANVRLEWLYSEMDKMRERKETLQLEYDCHFRGLAVMEAIRNIRPVWIKNKNELKQQLDCALGDSLLTAAALTIWGPATKIERNRLKTNWENDFGKKRTKISANWFIYFNIEQNIEWKSFSESISIVNNSTTNTKWPLIFDKNDLALQWLQYETDSNNCIVVSILAGDVINSIQTAVSQGFTLILTEIEKDLENWLLPLIDCTFNKDDAAAPSISIKDISIQFKQNFKLYMITDKEFSNFSDEFLSKTHPIRFESSVCTVRKASFVGQTANSQLLNFLQVSNAVTLLEDESTVNDLVNLDGKMKKKI